MSRHLLAADEGNCGGDGIDKSDGVDDDFCLDSDGGKRRVSIEPTHVGLMYFQRKICGNNRQHSLLFSF